MEISKLVRYIAYSLELYLLFVVQQTPGLFPEIYGARPVLLFPAVLSMAMLEREIPAMVFGVAAGLLVDFGFGGALGFHAIVLAVFCFWISILCHTILQVNLGTSSLLSIGSIALIVVLGWLYQYLWAGYAYPSYALVRHYLPKYVYTLLLFPITFLLNKGIFTHLQAPE